MNAGIPQLLGAAARNLPLFAFTNSNPTHRHLWTDVFAADLHVFREVFISSDIGLRKPDGDAFQAVANRMGLASRRIHFFDDTQENVDGAATIGMTATHVTSVESIAGILGSFE